MPIAQRLVGLGVVDSRAVLGGDDTDSSFDIAIFYLRHNCRLPDFDRHSLPYESDGQPPVKEWKKKDQ